MSGRHRLERVTAQADVIVKGGNRFNPRTFWRMPSDSVSWQHVTAIAEAQGWRAGDGDPSRVGSTQGPEDAAAEFTRSGL
jgi:hypothetical protein